MRAFWIFILLIPLVGPLYGIDKRDVLSELGALDAELSRSDDYLKRRTDRIQRLRSELDSLDPSEVSQHLDIMLKLGDMYSPYRVDSAIHYFLEGYRLSEKNRIDSAAALFAMRRAEFIPLQMHSIEAEHIADSLKNHTLPAGMLCEFHDMERQMYSYIAAMYSGDQAWNRKYSELESAARRRLLETLPHSSARYRFNLAEELYYSGNYVQSEKLLLELIGEIPEDDPIYARAAHKLAEIARRSDNIHGVVYFLARSAQSDVITGTLEVASLQELGQVLYRFGHVGRSYVYLTQALQNAVECQAPMRVLQTSQVLPIIQQAHLSQLEAQRSRTTLTIVVLVVAVIILFALIYIIYRRKNTREMLSLRLEEANRTKDVYLSKFLSLCSSYMADMQQFTKLVERKISAGKGDDLLRLAKSGKLIEEQTAEFFQTFDTAFLSIYPTFVEDVNRLLHEDSQVTLREGEALNTDLRILALMRLGIEDSSRIAQMLNYSVHTIYTYRNKFKNRAINRDTFERDVAAIRSI